MSTQSPAFSFADACERARLKKIDLGEAIREIEAESEHPEHGDIPVSPLLRAAKERAERVAQIAADHAAAEAAGTLWTVQAALYPGRAFVMVYQGRNDDLKALESQHADCHAVFGPLHIIGTQHEVMRAAHAQFRVNEITIRAVPAIPSF